MPNPFREQPLRLLSAAFVKRFSRSLRKQELWDSWNRPAYLTGVLHGADQARREGENKITVIEFGVASGRGLLELQAVSLAVETETGVEIDVYGFDSGSGLPPPSDYKDHPDRWQLGDYSMMNERWLRSQLTAKTSLILGNIATTVTNFVDAIQQHPIGFVAFDLDYYTSTRDAFEVFTGNRRNLLSHTPLYFDDTLFFEASSFAGELLAIREFNGKDGPVKIDAWSTLPFYRPFCDARWLRAMYVAHDMERVERVSKQQKSQKPKVL